MTSEQIRQQFLDFFVQKHGHTFVPSSPVVPHDDPTLLFTNAGMNQFKPIFLGQEKRAYTRATNTQKCIRAGGKHNDLDDVGRSRRHHTFFEMLGNWSFGDYFKRGAIEMAWELLTKIWKIDPTRLHVSCYEGDDKAGIPRDTEAAQLWKQIAGLPDDHIHYFGKDNFWEMGDTGPCGPCTEIYIDRTSDKTGGPQVNGDDPRVMEIWNLVFIQYNRDATGKLTPLPAQHVDTGMGFERICQVLQDRQDNYGTDLWTPLFDKISEISNLKYTGLFPKTNAADPAAEAAHPQLRHDIAFRVVADHVRCLTFALTDGAVPSNEGRGYVLRRILRRAVRFGRQQLGLNEPFMHKLVPVIVDSMSQAFPELKRNPQNVEGLIKDEEASFSRTLDRGISLFDEAASDALNNFGLQQERGLGGESKPVPFTEGIRAYANKYPRSQYPVPVISDDVAFKLHDTYGFPIDLTRIMAEERGLNVDIQGYETLMEKARDLARAGGKTSDSKLTDLPPSALLQLSQTGVKPTDDHAKFSKQPIQANIMAIWNGDDLGLSPANVFEDEELAIILDRTNFYAEMGGQVGDTGMLTSVSMNFDIETTKTIGGYTLHIGRLRTGKLQVGQTITATVQGGRDRTEKNHTSTHIANWALREVLGKGVQQKGSLVDPDKLRFDFSHGKSLSDDELAKIETLVNQQIENKLPVYSEEVPQEKALQINGLRAVFGEKYPPMVRVVSVGAPVQDLLADPTNPKWRQFSIEFCGGTHLANSREAESFLITAEESVSKGIRRIVALTGQAASTAADAARSIDALINKARETSDADLPPVIASLNQSLSAGTLPLRAKRRAQATVVELQSRYRTFEKGNKSQSTQGGVDPIATAAALLSAAPTLGPGKLIVGDITGASDDQLRSAIDSLKKKTPSYGILLAAASADKVTFIAAVSDDLIAAGLKAGDWVKEAAKVAGGGGGGRPQMAQAGGKDPTKLPDALTKAREFAMSVVKQAIMDDNARRFARRVLLAHLLLLVIVLTLVGLALREIYNSTREQVLVQAKARQSLLASQTARGIESYYQSILNNLDLLHRAENEEGGEHQPTPLPPPPETTVPERAMNAAGARGAIIGQILWKQLEGRVSLLFTIDRENAQRPKPIIRVVGSNDPALSPDQIVLQSRDWLYSLQAAAVGRFQLYEKDGANLVCVPLPRDRTLVAVVPIKGIEDRFLQSLHDDPETAAWLLDEQMTAMAASRPPLVGKNMSGISDGVVRATIVDDAQHGRAETTITAVPFSIGSVMFVPSMISAEPIAVGGKNWELFLTTSLSQVDDILSRLFHRALLWGIFVVISITAILLSTSMQLIRGRIRLERERHDLLSREVHQAREIQLAWLPGGQSPSEAIDIAALNSPASHISGDFYNWFELRDGRLVITIGDVTGHGISAAFLMATTQLLVRNTMDRIADPARCLEEVNRQLCVQVFNGQFVTMLILILDVKHESLELATAGHPAPLLGDGESFQPLPIEPQLVLGVERETTYITQRFKLPQQSNLLLYTDGVVDCLNRDGKRFNSDNLHRTLYGRYDSAQEMLDTVVNALDTFRGTQELDDDLTLVAIQVQAGAAARKAVTTRV